MSPPHAWLSGWYAVHTEPRADVDPAAAPRIAQALERVSEEGARVRLVPVRFCQHGSIYYVREDRIAPAGAAPAERQGVYVSVVSRRRSRQLDGRRQGPPL